MIRLSSLALIYIQKEVKYFFFDYFLLVFLNQFLLLIFEKSAPSPSEKTPDSDLAKKYEFKRLMVHYCIQQTSMYSKFFINKNGRSH